MAVVRPDATTGMANPQIFPILTDHLGTPRKVLDGNTGQVRWSWDAKQPFGHEMPNETPTASQAAFAFDLRFPGQRYDEETGLFHNGFRDYHSGLGRYVQSDPLGLEAGWNTYAYAGSNSLSGVDPYGLKVYLAAHEVAMGIYHLKVVVIPENQKKWSPYLNRRNGVAGGYMTFGGGPDGKFSVLGALYGGLNRPKDVSGNFDNMVELDLNGQCEDDVIRKMMAYTEAYNASGKYPYALFPDRSQNPLALDGEFNSNSYAAGLVLGAGLSLPAADKMKVPVPGYQKPAPIMYFDIFKTTGGF